MTYLSTRKETDEGRQSMALSRALRNAFHLKTPLQRVHLLLRQWAHTICFFVLTVLVGFGLPEGGARTAAAVFLLLWCYLDEKKKDWIETRHFGWTDVGMNALGVLLGGLFVLLISPA